MKVLAPLILLAMSAAGDSAGQWFGRGVWRGQEVTFRVREGLALYQDDIVIGRAADLEARWRGLRDAPSTESKNALRQATAIADRVRYWPEGVIPYEIDPSFEDTAPIQAAVRHWNERTAIRLIPRTGEANYVRFTRYSDPNVCSSSSLGMAGGRQAIYGSPTCPAPVLVHEIGHAVGLDHEQSREDRDRWVTILWENVSKFNRSQFAPFARNADLGPYDYESIMHYGVGDFGKSGAAIQTVPPGIPIRQGRELSPGDIDAVQRIYGPPPQETIITTTPAGLKLIVDGEEIETPKKFAWAAGSVHRIEAPERQEDEPGRYDWARWSDGGERVHGVTADAATTGVFAAHYVRWNRYRFDVSPRGAGRVEVRPPSPDGLYRDGAPISIVAVPAEGYAFRNWSGPYIELNNLGAFSPNPWNVFAHAGRHGLVANFAPAVARFDNATEGGTSVGGMVRVDGRVYRTPASFAWEPGSTHEVEVEPEFPDSVDEALVVFRRWSDGAPRVRTVTAGTAPASYVAIHAVQYGLDWWTSGSGAVRISPLGAVRYPYAWFEEGTDVTLSAAASDGSQFVGWAGDLSGVANPRSLRMTETMSAAAFFGEAATASARGIANAARDRPTLRISGNQFSIEVSPGEVVAVNVPGFAPDVEARADLSGETAPAALGGVRAFIGGIAAPLLAVAKGRVTAVVPYAVAGAGAVAVQLEFNGVRTAAGGVTVGPAVPSLYTADGSGSGWVRALNQDGGTNLPDATADRGSVVALWATGLGVPEGEARDGQVFTKLGPPPRGKLAMRIGSIDAEIVSAGLAPGEPGVYRIEARVPAGAAAGRAPVILMVDGVPSQLDVALAVASR